MFPSTIALYECFCTRGTRTTAPNRINDSCCGVCVTARLQAVAGNGDLMSYKWRNDLNYIYATICSRARPFRILTIGSHLARTSGELRTINQLQRIILSECEKERRKNKIEQKQ